MAYSQINSGAALTSADRAGADNFFEPVRLSMIAVSAGEQWMGGSRALAIADGGGYMDIPLFEDWTAPAAAYLGQTFVVVVETRVEDASITLTPKIRQVSGTPADITIGAASASVAGDADGEIWATQSLSFTPTAGVTYRIMAVKSADTFDAWVGSAKLRRSGT